MNARPPLPLATRLGYLALLPFAVGAAASLISRGTTQALVAAALAAYAVTVISFLGGIHWGFGFRQAEPAPSLFLWGVVPALVAWVASLLPTPEALVLHAAMLAVCFLVDRKVYPRQNATAWLPLRARLTVIAVLSCLLGSWATFHGAVGGG